MNNLEPLPEEKPMAKVNLNRLSRKLQGKIASYVVVGIIGLCVGGWWFSPSKTSKGVQEKKTANSMAGVTTESQFTPEVSKSAMDAQQRQIKELTDKLAEIGNSMAELQAKLEEKSGNLNPDVGVIDELRARMDSIESGQRGSQHSNVTSRETNSVEQGQEITTISFTLLAPM